MFCPGLFMRGAKNLAHLPYNALLAPSVEIAMASPLTASQVLDTYFLETRAKLIEIAATLDRLSRTEDAASMGADPRVVFIREALAVLQARGQNRAERIQLLYSTE
jgi:hypothetical protein